MTQEPGSTSEWATVTVTMPLELKEHLQAVANHENRSLAAQARHFIEQRIDAWREAEHGK